MIEYILYFTVYTLWFKSVYIVVSQFTDIDGYNDVVDIYEFVKMIRM